MSEAPDSPAVEAKRWLALALDDILTAQTILGHQDRALRNAAFLAQQAAEKALKAVLIAHQLLVPRVHDLVALARLLPVPVTDLNEAALEELTEWATQGRYPADLPEAGKHEVARLVQLSMDVVAFVQRAIGSPNGP